MRGGCVDGFGAVVETDGVVGAGVHHTLDAIAPCRFVDVVGANDVTVEDLVEGVLHGYATRMHDGVDASVSGSTSLKLARSQRTSCSCGAAWPISRCRSGAARRRKRPGACAARCQGVRRAGDQQSFERLAHVLPRMLGGVRTAPRTHRATAPGLVPVPAATWRTTDECRAQGQTPNPGRSRPCQRAAGRPKGRHRYK